MPVGASFHVLVADERTVGVLPYHHQATALDTRSNYPVLPPETVLGPPLVVTPSWQTHVSNPHPIGVKFEPPPIGAWVIYNLDGAVMPFGTSFNVLSGDCWL